METHEPGFKNVLEEGDSLMAGVLFKSSREWKFLYAKLKAGHKDITWETH